MNVNKSSDVKVENPKLRELFDKRKQCSGKDELAPIMNSIAEEIVMNARFISVVRMQSASASGNKAKFAFAMLSDGNGHGFFPIFTDETELMKWELAQKENPQKAVLGFDDYANMVLRTNGAEGVVVNPFSDNLTLNRATISSWRDKKQISQKGYAENSVAHDADAKITTPSPFPLELSTALSQAAKDLKEVKSLWLRQMELDGRISHLAIIDFDGERTKVFSALGNSVRPFIGDKPLNVVAYNTELGKRAVENVMPIYRA